jgi:hypothetical protein
MFNRHTLFIVGAGASKELNMPIGAGLAKAIHNKTSVKLDLGRITAAGDMAFAQELARASRQGPGDFFAAARLIHNGILLTHSIDEFLEIHQDDQLVVTIGKAAIAKSILEAERSSNLFSKPQPHRTGLDLLTLENTWHIRFMRHLVQGVKDVRQIFDNVSFIVFNYDRCLEYFLLHALQYLFGISDKDAHSILEELTIIHPFGDIGPLAKVPLGGPDTLDDLQFMPMSDVIQTYAEAAAGSKFNEIQVEVARALCFVFLGFAFHPEAMRLLMPATPLPTPPPVFATALGMSDGDAALVEHQITSMSRTRGHHGTVPDTVRLRNDLTCAQLFDGYPARRGDAS